MINKNEIEKIDIEEFLSFYGIKSFITSRGNANFCCPFHNDRSPSCGMHVKTGLWKCFGCGEAGNIITFVSKIEDISIEEAENKIRQKWIKKIPDIATLEGSVASILNKKEETQEEDPIYPDWILSQYTKNYDYMHNRGFNDETLEHFNVVYDPKTKYQGFPCRNLEGKIVGITGRNTQQGENRYRPLIAFRKSNYIYNLNAVDITKTIIAVEGEINCMAMWQHGFKNCVAFLGAGVSQTQLDVIRNYGVNDLIIFFDDDKAGINGAKKVFAGLWLEATIRIVPDHEGDPAEMNTDVVNTLVKNAEFFSIK